MCSLVCGVWLWLVLVYVVKKFFWIDEEVLVSLCVVGSSSVIWLGMW